MSLKNHLANSGRGAISELSRTLKVPVSLVSQWASGARAIPAERCPDIERATGVRCEELRPDVNWAVLREPTATPEPAAREVA